MGIHKLLVVDKDDRLRGLYTLSDIERIMEENRDHLKPARDSKFRLLCGAAVSTPRKVDGQLDKKSLEEHISEMVDQGLDTVAVSTAHGHTKSVGEATRFIRNAFPDLTIIAGNVTSGEGVEFLADAGANAIKVGQGPGSICTTRVVAGVGIPQMTALYTALQGAKKKGVSIIADGGIRYTGDIPKAIAAGADTVMLGSLLAGTKESPGETIIYEGRKFKSYRGMGSVEAMKQGSKDRYFQDVEDDIKKLVPEGIVGRVPYKGELFESMTQFIGGLRAGMGYCGAKNIETLKESAKFIKITASGIKESHPHNVTITKEAPNYSR